MDWKIWWRKAWRGMVAAAAAGAIAYATTEVTGIVGGDEVPPVMIFLGPVILHALGQAANECTVQHV